jgi:hypothetical protein
MIKMIDFEPMGYIGLDNTFSMERRKRARAADVGLTGFMDLCSVLHATSLARHRACFSCCCRLRPRC